MNWVHWPQQKWAENAKVTETEKQTRSQTGWIMESLQETLSRFMRFHQDIYRLTTIRVSEVIVFPFIPSFVPSLYIGHLEEGAQF